MCNVGLSGCAQGSRREMMGHEDGTDEPMDPYREPVPKPPVMNSEVSVAALYGSAAVTCEMAATIGGFCSFPVSEAVCPKTCNYTGTCHSPIRAFRRR